MYFQFCTFIAQKLPRDPSTGFQGGGLVGDNNLQHQLPQNNTLHHNSIPTAQIPASSSTSTSSSATGTGATAMVSLSGGNTTMNTMGSSKPSLIGGGGGSQGNMMSNRLINNNIDKIDGNHNQPQSIGYRNLSNIAKAGFHPSGKNSKSVFT